MFQPRRLFILGVLVALVISYVGPIRGYHSRTAELRQQEIQLKALITQRDAVRHKLANANTPRAVEARARELGYIKPGEVQFRIDGLEIPTVVTPRDGQSGIGSWFPPVA